MEDREVENGLTVKELMDILSKYEPEMKVEFCKRTPQGVENDVFKISFGVYEGFSRDDDDYLELCIYQEFLKEHFNY